MAASVIYSWPALYEAVMLLLYGRHYSARYRILADLIPAGSSVLDLCCGPAVLYHRYLRHKDVRYTGLDVSNRFIDRLRQRGAAAEVWDVGSAAALPTADYVVMQASLYQFLPDPSPVLHRMLQAARVQVIIAEPIRNLADSEVPLASALARRFTDPGNGPSARRFTEQSLIRFFQPYLPRCVRTFLIPGGRERIYVLHGSAPTHERPSQQEASDVRR